MDTGVILGNIIDFLFVALIFILVLGVTFKITLRNYNVRTSKLKFYGLFLGMDNNFNKQKGGCLWQFPLQNS